VNGRKDAAGPPLRMLFWESTSRCNLNCAHCRRLDRPDRELTSEQFAAVLDSAAALGKPIVVFSGGEPLLRDDWPELADHARGLGLPAALATNGTLIDDTVAEQIASAGFGRVSISLDAADAETHDAIRGRRGAFEMTMAGIAAMRDAHVPFQINATLTRRNADQLDELYDLAARLGAVALHLFLLVPVGCGLHVAATHQLSAQRCERILEWVCDRQTQGPLELRATCAPQYQRIAAQRGLVRPGTRGCLAGTGVLFVSSSGEVFPCGYLPVSCGSVLDRDLAAIWRDSHVLAELRDINRLGGKCGRCRYKAICGGCRARAYAATGDYLAAEPACAYEPP